MKSYRYQLARRGKWICPRCGRKTFVCYVDAEGRVLDERVGKCDRADHCAHHYPPRQFFADNSWMNMNTAYPFPSYPSHPSYASHPSYPLQSSRPAYPAPPARSMFPMPSPRAKDILLNKPRYIDKERIFKPSVKATSTHRNNLVEFLRTVFGKEKTEDMVRKYYIGTSKHFGGGATVFYQIDRFGDVHRGKVMQYDAATGKRVKVGGKGLVTSVHKLMNLGDPLPPQCLFGEHLLSTYPDHSVAIVESEKTALISSVIFYDCLMLACGGCGNLTRTLCEPLRDREVYLFPDNGKYDEWSEKGRQMRHLFSKLHIATTMEHEALEPGDDIGDYFLRHYSDLSAVNLTYTNL